MTRFDFIAAYIMADRKSGEVYVGAATNLPGRVEQHKQGVGAAFTRDHKCFNLVWFEQFETIQQAEFREQEIKRRARAQVDSLIESDNPDWLDLSRQLA